MYERRLWELKMTNEFIKMYPQKLNIPSIVILIFIVRLSDHLFRVSCIFKNYEFKGVGKDLRK